MNTSVWPPMLKRTYNVRTQLKSFSFQVLEISNMYQDPISGQIESMADQFIRKQAFKFELIFMHQYSKGMTFKVDYIFFHMQLKFKYGLFLGLLVQVF